MSPMVLASVIVLSFMLAMAGCQKRMPGPEVVAAPPAGALETGRAAFVAGDDVTAMAALSRAVAENPGSATASMLLGLCAARQGDIAKAEQALRRAAGLDPRDPRPLEALGIILYSKDNRAAAERIFSEAVKRGSTSPQVAYYQGNLAMFAHDCPGALRAYQRAMELDAHYAPASTEYRSARRVCFQEEERAAIEARAREAREARAREARAKAARDKTTTPKPDLREPAPSPVRGNVSAQAGTPHGAVADGAKPAADQP